MSLWGSIDQANNAPKSSIAGGLGIAANGQALFGNVSTVIVPNASIGDFGVSAVEAGVTTGDGKKVAHAGWNMRKQGTGYVINVALASPGANYRTNGFIALYSANGSGANVAYTVNTTTNTINSITVVSGGSGYLTAPVANAANATGANSATFSVTMGGRANRVHYETLVAMGSMSGDSENALFPNS